MRASREQGREALSTGDSLASAVDGTKVLADDLWEIFRVLLS